jgi:hypothetical protein
VRLSDAIWIAVIAAVPGLVTTFVTVTLGRREMRQAVNGVHVLVNSQKDALTKLLREALADNEELTHETTDQRATIVLLRQALDALQPPVEAPPHG